MFCLVDQWCNSKNTPKKNMEIPWRFFVPRSELGGASVLSASGLGGVVVPTVYGQAGGLGAGGGCEDL